MPMIGIDPMCKMSLFFFFSSLKNLRFLAHMLKALWKGCKSVPASEMNMSIHNRHPNPFYFPLENDLEVVPNLKLMPVMHLFSLYLSVSFFCFGSPKGCFLIPSRFTGFDSDLFFFILNRIHHESACL